MVTTLRCGRLSRRTVLAHAVHNNPMTIRACKASGGLRGAVGLLFIVVMSCGRFGFGQQFESDIGDARVGNGDVADGATLVASSCTNGEMDSGETDVDCGGSMCPPCLGGAVCIVDQDCNSGMCNGNSCAFAPTSGAANRLTNASGGSFLPHAVWTGSSYGLVWYDTRLGGSRAQIFFMELDTNGLPSVTETLVSEGSQYSRDPAITYTGAGYGIAWEDNRDANWEIYFARLDADGNKLGSDVRVSTTSGISTRSRIVWTGTSYLVLWADNTSGSWELYLAQLDAVGTIVVAAVPLAASSSGQPSVVWTGLHVAAAWITFEREIAFQRYTATGAAVSPEVILTNGAGYNASDPRLHWTGNGYSLVWVEDPFVGAGSQVYLAGMDSSGAIVEPRVRITLEDGQTSRSPMLSWAGDIGGLLWHQGGSSPFDVTFVVVDSAGQRISEELTVLNDIDSSLGSGLFWTGTHFAYFWYQEHEAEPGNNEIYSITIEPTGGM